MKQKLFTLFLALAASVGTIFAEKVLIGDFYYNLDATNQTAEITSMPSGKCTGDIVIQSSVHYEDVDYSVTSIGGSAFRGCSGLTSVTIPNSVTSISRYAFSECTNLTSFTIPNSIISINEGAFSSCTGLTSVTFGMSVSSMGYAAFANCTNLTAFHVDATNAYYCDVDGVLFNKGKTTLVQYPVKKSGTEYTIPNSITTIGDLAFYQCSGLTSITIPNSVTEIGLNAFLYSDGLTSIICEAVEPPMLGAAVFYSIDKSIPLYVPAESVGAYKVADQWKDFTNIQLIKCLIASGTCGDNLTWELSCDSVLTISGEGKMEDYSYATPSPWGNMRIKTIIINEGVTSIGDDAFRNCSSLTSVTIPNSVTSIGNSAFYKCSGLTSVTIPNSVTSIGGSAFYECSGLTSVNIPNSVTSIGDLAFAYCSGLTSIIVVEGNTEYDSRNNCNAIIKTATNTLVAGCKNTIIPNSVTSIGYYAFYYCEYLTSVTIPNSVTSIGDWAFYGCSGLTSVTCEASTPPACGYNVFYEVDKSIPVYVPAESIEAYKAAEGWKEFTNIQAIPPVGLFVDDAIISPLFGVPVNAWKVPYQMEELLDGSLEVRILNPFACSGKEQDENGIYNGFPYNDPGEWDESKDYNLVLHINPTTGDVVFVNQRNDLGVDWGYGMIYLSDYNNAVGTFDKSANKITFKAADKSLEFGMGSSLYGFAGFRFYLSLEAYSLENLKVDALYYILNNENHTAEVSGNNISEETEITIPSSITYKGIEYRVTGIRSEAFRDIKNSISLTIPNSINYISNKAFYNCRIDSFIVSDDHSAYSSVDGVLFNKDQTTLIAYPCGKVGAYTIPNSVINIASCAFAYRNGLSKVVFHENVTNISDSAFIYCSGLRELTIPNGVTSIGSHAFFNCDGLQEVVIGDNVGKIGKGAFEFCFGLKKVTIGKCIASFDDAVFWCCQSLLSFDVSEDNIAYSTIDGVLFNKNFTTLNVYPYGKKDAFYTIPNSVTLINQFAFAYCDSLTSVNIPSSVKEIGMWAFGWCFALTNVIIPNSVTSIGKYAFYACQGIETITIPSSVTSIGDVVFGQCKSLTSIAVAEDNSSYTSIDGVLFNKERTTLIQFPSGKEGTCAIPNGVTNIAPQAISYCDSLKAIICENTLPPTCTNDVFLWTDQSIPLYVPAGSEIVYSKANSWNTFTNILPIQQAAEVAVTEIEAEPTDNSVVIEWPKVNEATVYTIEIKKNGELICTLTFNELGQLLNIAFAAPSRNGNRGSAQPRMAIQTTTGWQYTISGLEANTTYTYNVIAKRNASDTDNLYNETITFTTKQTPTSVDEIQESSDTEVLKFIKNGQLFILRDGEMYNAQGARVE